MLKLPDQGYFMMDAAFGQDHVYDLYPFFGTDLGVCTLMKPTVGIEQLCCFEYLIYYPMLPVLLVS